MGNSLKAVKELAEQEVNNLVKHATKEEIANLDIDTFNGKYPNSCIYGQMTYDCESSRAYELMKLCCTRTIMRRKKDGAFGNDSSINGEPDILNRRQWYSPIETLVGKTRRYAIEIILYLTRGNYNEPFKFIE